MTSCLLTTTYQFFLPKKVDDSPTNSTRTLQLKKQLTLILKEWKYENTYSVMSVGFEVMIPTVKSVFMIAVCDDFGKFKAEAGFSVGLESFFPVETLLAKELLKWSSIMGCIQEFSMTLHILVSICFCNSLPNSLSIVMFLAVGFLKELDKLRVFKSFKPPGPNNFRPSRCWSSNFCNFFPISKWSFEVKPLASVPVNNIRMFKTNSQQLD